MFKGAFSQVPTFLSLDIDFFCYPLTTDENRNDVGNFLDGLLQISRDKQIPINAVMNHNQMLKSVDKSNARRLINLDAHSDLATDNVQVLEIGTWISYVKWRGEGEYVWLRNERYTHPGECGYSFQESHRSQSDWKSVRSHWIKSTPNVFDFARMNLVAISVCMSPMFNEYSDELDLIQWIKTNNIPYQKGFRAEHDNFKQCCPPKIS